MSKTKCQKQNVKNEMSKTKCQKRNVKNEMSKILKNKNVKMNLTKSFPPYHTLTVGPRLWIVLTFFFKTFLDSYIGFTWVNHFIPIITSNKHPPLYSSVYLKVAFDCYEKLSLFFKLGNWRARRRRRKRRKVFIRLLKSFSTIQNIQPSRDWSTSSSLTRFQKFFISGLKRYYFSVKSECIFNAFWWVLFGYIYFLISM